MQTVNLLPDLAYKTAIGYGRSAVVIMDGGVTVTLISVAMFVGCLLLGFIPLLFRLSEVRFFNNAGAANYHALDVGYTQPSYIFHPHANFALYCPPPPKFSITRSS